MEASKDDCSRHLTPGKSGRRKISKTIGVWSIVTLHLKRNWELAAGTVWNSLGCSGSEGGREGEFLDQVIIYPVFFVGQKQKDERERELLF